jgi:hypothetical protein
MDQVKEEKIIGNKAPVVVMQSIDVNNRKINLFDWLVLIILVLAFPIYVLFII